MSKFKRISRPILDGDGITIDTSVTLSNGAKIKILGGDISKHFRLRFGNSEGAGWWLDPPALDELIAELLYIREEVNNYQPVPEEVF